MWRAASRLGAAVGPGRQPTRALAMSPWPFSATPRDYSVPNESWSREMRRLFDHYSCLCDTEEQQQSAGWCKFPSYNRSLKHAAGGKYLSKMVQAKARLFTRNIEEPGAGFEYAVFLNKQEKTSVTIFQPGHLLEGPPGHLHGGAIATIIDSSTGTLAGALLGPSMTANLNINYRSPIPLGNVVLIHCKVDQTEGRKTFMSCQITSSDGDKLHTEATGLFLSINLGRLFGA
ncbi:acyl-coenzyme A thioesterase THEM4 [Denticeps clupeoides]|uniref:Acyl-coenzyme A thioesterase THEM4 n=1 Tax=Denticeps clupeoides TaxID=299321 RepID=A0AAY4AI86_9TELE|nr:acyl-coenzyme A thioesterase THEM4-like [Denticeps clupeoides]